MLPVQKDPSSPLPRNGAAPELQQLEAAISRHFRTSSSSELETIRKFVLTLGALGESQRRTARAVFDHAVQVKKPDQRSLLYTLLEKKEFKAVHILIDLGVSEIDVASGPSGETPLFLAARGWTEPHRVVVEALVQAGVNINRLVPHPHLEFTRTALSECLTPFNRHEVLHRGEIFSDATLMAKLLLDLGANPNLGETHGFPPFNFCIDEAYCYGGQALRQIAILMLECKSTPVNVCATSRCGTPALHSCVMWGWDSMARTLIQRGAKVNQLAFEALGASRSVSPLFRAVVKGDLKMVRLLMERGADCNQRAENPLFGKPASVRMWSEAEPLTPFQLAVATLQDEIVESMYRFKRGKVDLNAKMISSWRHFTSHRTGAGSFQLRLDCVHAKQEGEISGLPGDIRCYARRKDVRTRVKEAFKLLYNKSSPGWGYLRGLLGALETVMKTDPKFGVYVIPKSVGGSYCPETGQHLIVAAWIPDALTAAHILIHEMTHMAADKLYHRSSPGSASFQQALAADLKRLEQTDAPCHRAIRSLFLAVRSGSYEEAEWPGEYLARIPEAIAKICLHNPSLSRPQLDKILEDSIPHLTRYLRKEFLPAVEKLGTRGKGKEHA